MTFSFTATAKCDECGQLLGSSDENCDHDGAPVDKHLFRELGEGRESLVGVKTTNSYKWHKLAQKVGDYWIAYQYLGPKSSVNRMLQVSWDSVKELPQQEMSASAPSSVNDE
jgi:hypothetical protein